MFCSYIKFVELCAMKSFQEPEQRRATFVLSADARSWENELYCWFWSFELWGVQEQVELALFALSNQLYYGKVTLCY